MRKGGVAIIGGFNESDRAVFGGAGGELALAAVAIDRGRRHARQGRAGRPARRHGDNVGSRGKGEGEVGEDEIYRGGVIPFSTTDEAMSRLSVARMERWGKGTGRV